MYRLYLTPEQRRKENEEKKRKELLNDRPGSYPFSHPMMDKYFEALEKRKKP